MELPDRDLTLLTPANFVDAQTLLENQVTTRNSKSSLILHEDTEPRGVTQCVVELEPRVSPEPTASSSRSEKSTGTHARPLRVCEPQEAWLRVWRSDRAFIRGAERGGSLASSSPVAQLRLLQAHFLLLTVTKNV